MTAAAVKEKLHDYINHADSKKIKAIYTLLENDIEPDHEFNDGDIKELDKRWNDYLSGKSRSYTLEEAMTAIKKHRDNKKKHGV